MRNTYLLIDCGGSGVKINVQGNLCSFKPSSLEEFYKCIEDMVSDNNSSTEAHIAGIAVSVCGEYDYINEEVTICPAYPFLVGRLKDNLIKRFKCSNVHIVNDGDAHVLALKTIYAQEGKSCASAINLSLGTAVGFGILDWNGNLLHTCQGCNWELDNWKCDTTATHKELCWALGSNGLRMLEEEYGDNQAYIYFGQRLCHFLGRELANVFHPKTIGISGGIVASHSHEIEAGINRECELQGYRESGGSLQGVDIRLFTERHSVMKGLANLLNIDILNI